MNARAIGPMSRRPPTVMSGRLGGIGSSEQPCFVQLGRYGDIINLLPVLRDVFAKTGKKPALVCSAMFADLFEGVSYVDPIPLNVSFDDIQPALREARKQFRNVTVSQVHASGWTPGRTTSAYNMESWRLCGYLDRWADPSMRPVFDRRCYTRERAAIDRFMPVTAKPIVLLNARAGHSSPFTDWEAFQRTITEAWSSQVEFVDIGDLRTGRIFDLVGMMELADGIISIDTATLHLAACAEIPVIALLSGNRGWFQSAPKTCNWIHSCTCTEWRDNLAGIHAAIQSIVDSRSLVFHTFEVHGKLDARSARAQESWSETGWTMVPFEHYPRDSRRVLGDARSLPYIRDMIAHSLDRCAYNDILVLTNSDIRLEPGIDQELRSIMRRCVMATGRRIDLDPEQVHCGRDLVAWKAGWLRLNIDTVQELILGASNWDNWAWREARRLFGKGYFGNIDEHRPDHVSQIECEVDYNKKLIRHERHAAYWISNKKSPSEVFNRLALEGWKRRNLP